LDMLVFGDSLFAKCHPLKRTHSVAALFPALPPRAFYRRRAAHDCVRWKYPAAL